MDNDTGRIESNIKQLLSSDPQLGEFGVEVRTGYNHQNPNDKAKASLRLILSNPVIETDPGKVEKHVLARLGTVDALKPYVAFEQEPEHLKRLAETLSEFIRKEAELNAQSKGERITTIPPEYAKWFEELPKRNRWSVKHALNVRQDPTLGTTEIVISVPKDADAAAIVANINGRLDAIKDTLANRVVKYTPSADTDEKKAALTEQVKKLHMSVSVGGSDDNKAVFIKIMSDEQRQFMDKPGSAPPKDDELQKYIASNPLNALKDGNDDKNPENPPHLKKALARSFLFAGDKANDIFPLIAGKEDMKRAVRKSLVKLKNRQPENANLGKEIDLFLNDDVFKTQVFWDTPINEREDLKEMPKFLEYRGEPNEPYRKGMLQVALELPADKFPEIRSQLAAMEAAPSAAMPAAALGIENPQTAVGAVTPEMEQRALAEALKQVAGAAPAVAGRGA